MLESVGMIETTSIGLGYAAQDAMLKAADVRLLLARTICSGKYIVAVTGPVAEVSAAVDAGIAALPEGLIDHAVIPRIHPTVFQALGQAVELHVPLTINGAAADGSATNGAVADGSAPNAAGPKALGVIETFSGVSILEAADAAAKAAAVQLICVHLAMALGGKGYLLMAGAVADVQTAVHAAAEVVRRKGLLVSSVAIPGPSRELFAEYL
ncbi:MAG: BMC domain-containing protein [Planctomycetota bacterium]